MHYLVSTALVAVGLFGTPSIASTIKFQNIAPHSSPCKPTYLVSEGTYTVSWTGVTPAGVSDFYVYIPDPLNSNGPWLLNKNGPSGQTTLQADDDGTFSLCVNNETGDTIEVDVGLTFHSNGNVGAR